jgi:hypothetical protein
VTCYTAIIGGIDDLKDPKIITPGWKYICFTDQPFKSKVWEIVKVKCEPGNERILSKFYKLLPHLFIQDKYTMWVDGSFEINCDLNAFWEKFKAPLTFMQHPFRNCVYKEIDACIKNRRDDIEILRSQYRRYRNLGIVPNNGMIASGVILRENCEATNTFCQLWFDELKDRSLRDQVAWGFAHFKMPISHRLKWDYRTSTDIRYLFHLKHAHKRKLLVK